MGRGRAAVRAVGAVLGAVVVGVGGVGGAGASTAPAPVWPPTSAPLPVDQRVVRIAGEDRVATGVAASRMAFPDGGVEGAVVARADGFADALAGAALTVELGPMLLTGGSALDPRVAQELRRVVEPGGTVFVLGTTEVLSEAVEDAVTGLGFSVTRLGGEDRYATAAAIARHVQPVGNPTFGCGFVLATGRSYPDGLSAAGIAGSTPLLFTDGYQMPQESAAEIQRCLQAEDRQGEPLHITAVGGPAVGAVPPGFFASHEPRITTIAGGDRYETSARALASTSGNGEELPRDIVIATGEDFPDALVGIATFHARRYQVSTRGALTGPGALPASVRTAIADPFLPLHRAWVMGGPDVVPETVLPEVEAALDKNGCRWRADGTCG